MAVAGHHEIDAAALPYVLPRVGDQIAKLYHNKPPTPIRCRSTLRQIHLTPSDFKAMSDAELAQQSPRDAKKSSNTLMTSYSRFFEVPEAIQPQRGSFNNPHAHRTNKGAFESSQTTHLFGHAYAATPATPPNIPMPPPLGEGRSSIVPSNTTPRPSSVTPAVSPRKTYADRILAQAETEEQQLLAAISARRAEHERVRTSPRREAASLDIGKMRNLFLESVPQPNASPRRRVLMW